jgi:hypothetical protein
MATSVVNIHSKAKYDVFIGRPSKWGNPFSHLLITSAKYRVETREQSIQAYREWILHGDGRHLLKDLHELRGKVLGCTCLPFHCHGHILAELADNWEGDEEDCPELEF